MRSLQGVEGVVMSQIDLLSGAILPREQFLEVLVERGFEATYRVPAPGGGGHPPAEGVLSVLVNVHPGPVHRICYLP